MAKDAKTADAPNPAAATSLQPDQTPAKTVEMKEVKAISSFKQQYGAKRYSLEQGKSYKLLPEIAEHFRKQGLVF